MSLTAYPRCERCGQPHRADLACAHWTPGRATVAGCAYCEREVAAGNTFFPRHDASSRCRSGHRSHCTCDTCF